MLLLAFLLFVELELSLLLRILGIYIYIYIYRYLPYDATGDWFYHISEILAVIFTIIVMVRIKGSNRYTYDRDYDKIKYYFMAIPCLVLAFFIHPTLNKNLFTDTAWAFSIYLECIAIFPQLLLMHNKVYIYIYIIYIYT